MSTRTAPKVDRTPGNLLLFPEPQTNRQKRRVRQSCDGLKRYYLQESRFWERTVLLANLGLPVAEQRRRARFFHALAVALKEHVVLEERARRSAVVRPEHTEGPTVTRGAGGDGAA